MPFRRVALVCETSLRYIYPQVTDLAEFVARAGHEVTIFTGEDGEVRAWNANRGFTLVEIIRPASLPARLWNPFFITAVMRHLRPFDAVVTFTSPTLPLALAADRLLGKRVIHLALELHVPTDRSAKGYAVFQNLLRRSNVRVFTTGRHRSRLLKAAYNLSTTPGEFLNAALARTTASAVGAQMPVVQRVRELSGQTEPIVLLCDGGLNELNMLDCVVEAQVPISTGVAISLIGPCSAAWRARLKRVHERTGNYFYLGEVAGTRYDVIRVAAGVDLGFVLKRSNKSLPANDRLYTPNKLFDFLAAGVVPIISDQLSLRFVEREGLGYRPKVMSVEGLRTFLLALPARREELARTKRRVQEEFLSRYHFEATAAPVLDALT